MTANPFILHVPDADIADLRDRLARTRFPDAAPGEPWAYGTSVDYMRELVAYWRDGFDWRIARARVEALRFLGVAPARRHDLALLQEGVGDRDRLIEQSAGVVAQVDDVALELVAGLGGKVGDRLLQAFGGLLVE